MLTESSITIQAPREQVFELTSDILRWPAHLPHYRYVRELQREDGAQVVKMACVRSGLPIAWVSRYTVHREAWQARFEHLKAWTKGMKVVWHYDEVEPGKTHIRLSHDLDFRWPPLAPIAEAVIGGFFIEHIAAKTLATFKQILERQQ